MTMNFNLIRTSTLVLGLGLFATVGAYAQSTERKVFVQPHVLDAKVSAVCAPRDAATGQSSGRRSSDYLMQLDDKKRLASAPACDDAASSTSSQTLRESPTLASSKHTQTGHVTLMK